MTSLISLASLSLLPLIFMMTSCEHLANPDSCTCRMKSGIFRDCNEKDVWKTHTELGLHGDCLPHVELNTRRCFRWRAADDCGVNGDLKCSLRHRPNQYEKITITSEGKEAHLSSPGFYRKNPGYSNENFCIYNISLDCSDNLVEITSNLATTSLSNTTDYLAFHVARQIPPVTQLSGEEIVGHSSLIPSSKFYAVLYSDDDNQQGRFSLTAKCAPNLLEDTGSGM